MTRIGGDAGGCMEFVQNSIHSPRVQCQFVDVISGTIIASKHT
jgi:hypothetical protein